VGHSPRALARPAAPLAVQTHQRASSSESVSWFVCFQRIGCISYRTLTPSTECRRNSLLSSADKTDKDWLLWQRPLVDRETNVRLIVYSHSSMHNNSSEPAGRRLVERKTLTSVAYSHIIVYQQQQVSAVSMLAPRDKLVL